MRVAVYHGRDRIALEDRPDPVAGAGELVVRVRACGLCGSDLMDWYQEPRAPTVLGHEPAGEVIAAGEGAPPLPLGRRVFVHHHVPCMTCDLCRAGRHTLCTRFRETRIDPGGLAEMIRVPAENAALDVLALPDEVPDWAATLIEPLGCVIHGQRMAGVGPGVRVAVVGAGSMGLLQIGAALAAGAAAVVAVEPREGRRAAAIAAGAVAALTRRRPGRRRRRARRAGRPGVRLHVRHGGDRRGPPPRRPRGRRPAVRAAAPGDAGAARPRRRLLPRGDDPAHLLGGPPRHPGRPGGARVRRHRPRRRDLPPRPLEEVEEAFRLARSGEATKVVVEP